jgi:TonB family protein
MTEYNDLQPSSKQNWKIALVAILVSLLIHQALFFALDLLGIFEPVKKEKKMEITLLEKPKPPETDNKKTKTEKKQPPAPLQKTKKIQKPIPKQKKTETKPLKEQPQKVQPQMAPNIKPAGPPLPEPIATAPNALKPTPGAIKIRPSFGTLERTFGEKAKEQRIAYKAESMKKRGGGYHFGTFSKKVAKALKNHSSWIAGAPKEPLDKRAAIFRNYLEATHDKIHMLFADSFLPSLVSLGASNPLNNFNLMALLEFEILENGTVNEVHVIRTSGQAVFDAAAVDSLYRSSPFLPPPKAVLSWNHRVYFRWGFYRNNRKCGTFNAQGYILKAPSAAPQPISYDKFRIIDG